MSTNMSLSEIAEFSVIGCTNHRFNRAMCDLIGELTESVQQIWQIIVKLRTLKCAAKLRCETELRCIFSYLTRWSSIFQMLKRYTDLQPVVKGLVIHESSSLITSNVKNTSITKFLDSLTIMESVIIKLQSENTTSADMKALFDAVKIYFLQEVPD